MKVIATSDLHGDLPLDVPECDLFIIAGDSCPVRGSHEVSDQENWVMGPFRNWIKELPAKNVVFIGGNHDFVMELESFNVDPEKFGAHYLRDSGIEIDGLYLYGFPWVPNLPTWAFHADRATLQTKIEAIPERTDILISHGPPENVLDQVSNPGYPHVGCPFMYQQVERRIQPALYVCGHIHESCGIEADFGNTVYANVAQMDRNYNPINPMVEFDLQHEEGKWVVKSYAHVDPDIEPHHNED